MGWCACAKNVCDDLSIPQCPVAHFPRRVHDPGGLAHTFHELQIAARRIHLRSGICPALGPEAGADVGRLVEMRAERPAERNTRTREPCKENAKNSSASRNWAKRPNISIARNKSFTAIESPK